jgi:hypothetical protein
MRLDSEPTKTGAALARGAAETRVTYRDVLRALGRDVVRFYALDRLRDRGFDADLCANPRKGRPHREALADALTATEDWLEYEHPRWPERETIRVVRRRLELELWP